MLTESVCVTDRGAGTNPLAMKMAEVLAGGGNRLHRRIGNVDWLRRAWAEA